MSRKTDQEHMDRIREARGLPPLRTQEDAGMMMSRTRAALAFVNGNRGTEALKMAAFLAIFHPEMSEEKTRELVQSKRGYGR